MPETLPVSPTRPVPAHSPAPPGAPALPVGSLRAAGSDEVIQLSLAPILAALSSNLAPLVASSSHGTFALPVRTALAQLASGAVRIPFGELRQGSPRGTFSDNTTQDRSPVSLPLAQILASINPALLARRPGQQMVVVPEDITSLFGKGRALQAPVSAPLTSAPAPSAAPAPVAAPAPAPMPVRAPAPLSWPPEPGVSQFTRPPVTMPLPSLVPRIPAPAFAACVEEKEKEVLAVTLSDLAELWPAPVRQEIEELRLQGTTISLPMNRLETGLKTGRVNFTWGELSHWLQPPPENTSALRDTTLELPLKVIAPIFLARRRPGSSKKVSVAANIPDNLPDLFARTSGPATAVAAPARDVLADSFGVPGKTDWSPQEICQRICALEGVAGGALAMSDGLLVAGKMPEEMNADTVAAFLPQIFSRVSQSISAMELEPVTSVLFTAGQARLAIFKTSKLYLAVLGHPGATLPEAMLGRIAAEIAKRNP